MLPSAVCSAVGIGDHWNGMPAPVATVPLFQVMMLREDGACTGMVAVLEIEVHAPPVSTQLPSQLAVVDASSRLSVSL